MFDVTSHLDELRSWPTDRLVAHHEALVRQVRRMELEDLDVLRVLDERGQIDVSTGRDGESARRHREKVETARELESLPAVAAAAHEGALSGEQLAETVKLADATTDEEWARRAPAITPADLARMARGKSKPTVEESRAQYDARSFWMRWREGRGMLQVEGELPPIMGAPLEVTINDLVERMRPAKGQAWERRGRRTSGLSPKVARAVLRRDGHCRCGECDLRYGLHVHHLRPRSWGGGDEPSNLAVVASVHHPLLIPHGSYALVGNPNRPDGLRMKRIDDLTPEEAEQVALPPPRARPGAA